MLKLFKAHSILKTGTGAAAGAVGTAGKSAAAVATGAAAAVACPAFSCNLRRFLVFETFASARNFCLRRAAAVPRCNEVLKAHQKLTQLPALASFSSFPSSASPNPPNLRSALLLAVSNISSPPTPASAPPPAAFPAPGWLFFLETLPLAEPAATGPAGTPGATAATAATAAPGKTTAPAAAALDRDRENIVRLSLDSHAPLPVEHLAYGWVADTARASLLYYATGRDRLRQAVAADYDRALFVLPDFLLAPPPASPGEWQWLATPAALTAVRFAPTTAPTPATPPTPATLSLAAPAEIRSWSLDPAADAVSRARHIRTLRTANEPDLPGPHAAATLFWAGATLDRAHTTLLPHWKTQENPDAPDANAAAAADAAAPLAAALPTAALWRADLRERPWLDNIRKLRTGTRRANTLLKAAAAAALALLLAAAALQFYKTAAQNEATRAAARQKEVDEINAKTEQLEWLDDLQAGEITHPANSLYDALATLNHYRPTGVLFSRAKGNAKREIQITGTAATRAQVTAYVNALRANGSFAKVTDSAVAGVGSTTFDLNVTVRSLNVTRSAALTAEEQEIMRSFLSNPASAVLPVYGKGASHATASSEQPPIAARQVPPTASASSEPPPPPPGKTAAPRP
jgi:hypothetical protein